MIENKILKECAEETEDEAVAKGYSDAVNKLIELIKPTLEWLNNCN